MGRKPVELTGVGRNVLRTLSAAEAAADPYGEEGSLSLSDVIYVRGWLCTSVGK